LKDDQFNGAVKVTIMTQNIMTLSIIGLIEALSVLCCAGFVIFIVMLNVVMLNAVLLRVVMLNVL